MSALPFFPLGPSLLPPMSGGGGSPCDDGGCQGDIRFCSGSLTGPVLNVADPINVDCLPNPPSTHAVPPCSHPGP